jgi:hypothetical protein
MIASKFGPDHDLTIVLLAKKSKMDNLVSIVLPVEYCISILHTRTHDQESLLKHLALSSAKWKIATGTPIMHKSGSAALANLRIG